MLLINGVLVKLPPASTQSRCSPSSPTFTSAVPLLPELEPPKKLFQLVMERQAVFRNACRKRSVSVRALMKPRPLPPPPQPPHVRSYEDERLRRLDQRIKSRDRRRKGVLPKRRVHLTMGEGMWKTVTATEGADTKAVSGDWTVSSGPVSVTILEPSSKVPVREPLVDRTEEEGEDEQSVGAQSSPSPTSGTDAQWFLDQAEEEGEGGRSFFVQAVPSIETSSGEQVVGAISKIPRQPIDEHPAVSLHLSALLGDLLLLPSWASREEALKNFVRELDWLDRRTSAKTLPSMTELNWESLLTWLRREDEVMAETQGFSMKDLMKIRRMFSKYQNKEEGLKTNQLFDLFVNEFQWKPVTTDEQIFIIDLVKDLDFNDNGLLDYDEFIHLLAVIVRNHQSRKFHAEFICIKNSDFSWRSVVEIRRLFWQLAVTLPGHTTPVLSVDNLRRLVRQLKQSANPDNLAASRPDKSDPVMDAARLVLAGHKGEGLTLGEVFGAIHHLALVDDLLRTRIFVGDQDPGNRPYGVMATLTASDMSESLAEGILANLLG